MGGLNWESFGLGVCVAIMVLMIYDFVSPNPLEAHVENMAFEIVTARQSCLDDLVLKLAHAEYLSARAAE